MTLSLLLQVSQDKVKALLRLSELERVQVQCLTCCLHSLCTAPIRAGARAHPAQGPRTLLLALQAHDGSEIDALRRQKSDLQVRLAQATQEKVSTVRCRKCGLHLP